MKKDSLKCIQDAWVQMILDYRAWFMPENSLMREWKNRKISHALKSCPARMMDDSEAMLSEYRKTNNTNVVGGASAFMPVALTATAVIDQPPLSSLLISAPYMTNVEINGKFAKMRMKPTAVRAQLAFFTSNPNDARSVAEQFCMYMSDDEKRKIKVNFDLGGGESGQFGFMVLENELFPSPVPSEAINISIVTVDATILGYVPQVIGLDEDQNIDNGIDDDAKPVDKPLDDSVVIQADKYSNDGHSRVTADKATGITVVEFNVDD